jgi:hypothetical protein
LFVVSEGCISGQIRTDKTRRELAENGIDTADVPASTIEMVSKLGQDDSVFLKMGKLVAQHIPTAERVGQMVARINKAKSEDARLGLVKTFEKDLSEDARAYGNKKQAKLIAPKAPLRPRRDRVISELTRLADFLDHGKSGEGFGDLTELQVVGVSDKKLINELWQRLERRMSLILKDRG